MKRAIKFAGWSVVASCLPPKRDAAGLWDEDLQCHWLRWEAVGPDRLRVMLPVHNCTSMRGAIEVGARLLPTVRAIETYAGNRPDTFYKKSEDGWYAILHDRLSPEAA